MASAQLQAIRHAAIAIVWHSRALMLLTKVGCMWYLTGRSDNSTTMNPSYPGKGPHRRISKKPVYSMESPSIPLEAHHHRQAQDYTTS